MTMGHAFTFRVEVIAIAQAVSVLELFATTRPGLVVPPLNNVVTRARKGRKGTGILGRKTGIRLKEKCWKYILNLTLLSLAFLIAFLAVLEIIRIATLAIVHELRANAIMPTVMESTCAFLPSTLFGLQVAVFGAEIPGRLAWPVLGFRLETWSDWHLLSWFVALSLALLLLLKIVAITVATSIVELSAATLHRVEVPTSRVVLAGARISRQFTGIFDCYFQKDPKS